MKDELNYVTIEATGFRDICRRMAELEEENRQLQAEIQEQAEELTNFISEIEDLEHKVEILTRMKNGLKINNGALTLECNTLCERNMELSKELADIKKMSMFEFSNKYCSIEQQEADGRAFAKSLLGGK